MKLALIYCSPDMYTHECKYIKTNTIEGNEEEIFDYYVNEWTTRAAVKMYTVDVEAGTVVLYKERLLPLKTKIVINAKKSSTSTRYSKPIYMDLLSPVTTGFVDDTFAAAPPSIGDVQADLIHNQGNNS